MQAMNLCVNHYSPPPTPSCATLGNLAFLSLSFPSKMVLRSLQPVSTVGFCESVPIAKGLALQEALQGWGWGGAGNPLWSRDFIYHLSHYIFITNVP